MSIKFDDLVKIHEKEIPGSSIVFTRATQKMCTLPYEDHKKGCPNYGKSSLCPPLAKYRDDIINRYNKFILVYAVFDFKKYKELRKQEHVDWSDRQLANVLYWQSSVRKMLKDYVARKQFDEILGAGNFGVCQSMEASGIYVFKTLRNNGINDFEIKPKSVVYMVCLLLQRGKQISLLDYAPL